MQSGNENERRFVESLPLLQQRFLSKLAYQDGASTVDIEQELSTWRSVGRSVLQCFAH